MENSRPAPSGETRGTCDGYLRHAPHTEAEHKSNCLKPGLPRWEWKPLAPEATTKEPAKTLAHAMLYLNNQEPKNSDAVEILNKAWAAGAKEYFSKVAPGEAVGRETREQLQAEFEEWGKDRFIMSRYKQTDFKLDYQNGHTDVAWQGWKGRAEFESSELSTLRRERDQLLGRVEILEGLHRAGATNLENWETSYNTLYERAHVLQSQVRELTARIKDYEEVNEDKKRLVRELDHALFGDDAAPQASLCDLIEPARKLVAELRDTAEKMQKVLEQMLASASPNPKEHPTMTVAWANARRELSDMRKGRP